VGGDCVQLITNMIQNIRPTDKSMHVCDYLLVCSVSCDMETLHTE